MSIASADQSAFNICQQALAGVADIPEFTLPHLVHEMDRALKELCALDTQYTSQGCIYGSLQPKWDRKGPTNRLLLRLPSDSEGRRPRNYIGSDPLKQKAARLSIERWKARNVLRTGAAALFHRQAALVEAAFELEAQAALLRADLKQLLGTVRTEALRLESERSGTTDGLAIE